MNAYRAGYNTMWKYAGPYMRRKGFKQPGEFRKDNQHGGRLWASRKECQMTDRSAGEIIERVYESGKVGVDQLKQVRHSLSYAYYLTTSIQGENYPEVYAQWKTFDLTKLPGVRRPVKPVRIPIPANLKLAFTTPWSSAHPQSLTTFTTGVLCTYDTHIFGLRPNVDTKKVKDSRSHFINANEGYGKTKMVEGRSKLHLSKRGTREWWVYRVCTCKGKHKGPSERQSRVKKDGNPKSRPTWDTCCPVAAMEFLHHHQGANFRCYPKWNKSGNYGETNHGDVPGLANRWLEIQGQSADGAEFDRNSGRKSLARWLAELGVPYKESIHIHGDLEEVWRDSYQDSLHKSHYRVRLQSTDPDTATKGLRRFAKWLNGEKTGPSLKEKLLEILSCL